MAREAGAAVEEWRREGNRAGAPEVGDGREGRRDREGAGAEEGPAALRREPTCPKNRVNWFLQALLGRSCTKDQDILYSVSPQQVGEKTQYSCALTFPTQDASQHFDTGLFHSGKEAEMEAARLALGWLEPLGWQALERKRKGKNPKDLEGVTPVSAERIDAVDGQAYTYEAIAAYYKGKFKEGEVEEYWNSLKPATLHGGSHGKLTAEGRAQQRTKEPGRGHQAARWAREAAGGATWKAGDWQCPSCGDHQFARNVSCRSCGSLRA